MHEFLLISISLDAWTADYATECLLSQKSLSICPTNLTGDQRCCPVINDARVNDFATPIALNNSMSHFRHMQFLSLSIQADTTRLVDMLSVFCIVTPCTSVCLRRFILNLLTLCSIRICILS